MLQDVCGGYLGDDISSILELTFPVADFSEIKMEILKHGDMVEVIRPKSFRELIKAEAKSIADIY